MTAHQSIALQARLCYLIPMTKKYTIRLADKAAEKLLALAGWSEDSGVPQQKALSDWLHRTAGEEPPKHGGRREGAFVGKKAAKKKSTGENSD